MQHQYHFPPTASFSHKNQTDMQKLTLVDFWQQNLYWENRPIISIGIGLPTFMALPRQLPRMSQHSTRFGIWWNHLSKTNRQWLTTGFASTFRFWPKPLNIMGCKSLNMKNIASTVFTRKTCFPCARNTKSQSTTTKH